MIIRRSFLLLKPGCQENMKFFRVYFVAFFEKMSIFTALFDVTAIFELFRIEKF